MRILMIATGNSRSGGGEKHVLDLSQGLIERGHEVMVMAPGGGDFLDEAARIGCATYIVESFGPFSSAPKNALEKVALTFDPDVVHAHGPRAAFTVRRGATDLIDKLVYTIHGIHARHGSLAPIKLAVERADVNKVTAYIVITEADLEEGTKLGIIDPERTTLIINGVPAPKEAEVGQFRAELGISSGRKLILHVGRINTQKNHPLLIKAFDLAWHHAPDDDKPILVMIAAGTDTEIRRLQQQIDGYKSAADMHIVAPRPELATAYSDADLFVLSSLWEGRPYVLVEAMQYGMPIISTDVDGINEMIEHEATGLLVPPNDADAFASAIAKLLTDDVLREHLGKTAQVSVTGRFTIDEMVDRTLEVYESIAGSTL